MKKVAFYTLGCKVNQYETDALKGLFLGENYEIVDFEQPADVYVINTCTVTSLSDRKSRQMIRKAKKNNPNSIVAVVGCYAQTSPDEVADIPGVNLVLGTRDRNRILDYIRDIEKNGGKLNAVSDIMKSREYEELRGGSYESRTRAYIKIQEGCTQFCSYCIIPYARGPVRSRSPEDILSEVENLARAGFREVVLTGIHIASYGRDIGGISLMDIVRKVHEVDGIERLRLGSIEPTTITRDFVETAISLPKLCPHFHISLQSGCTRTLKRMNRKYTADEYRESLAYLRKFMPEVAVTTDVMVGFPGETEEDFEESFRFVEEMNFAKVHVFKYSRRKGTPAASFPDQVDPAVKEKRSKRMIELSLRKTVEYNQKFIGRVMPVLVEQETGDGKTVEGLTPNYIRVVLEGDINLKGSIKNVILKNIAGDHVTGVLAD